MRTMNMNYQAQATTSPAVDCIMDSPLQSALNQMSNGSFGNHTAGQSQYGVSHSSSNLLLSGIADGSLTLSTEAAAGLVYMIEEEKMARDLYDTFAEQTGSVVFDKISDSEQMHYDTLLLAAQKAGIDLSSVSTTAGVFANTAIQSLYDTLLAQGSESLAAATQVGILVENTDISDLSAYSADSSIGVIGTIYANLETASEHHLAAFARQSNLIA